MSTTPSSAITLVKFKVLNEDHHTLVESLKPSDDRCELVKDFGFIPIPRYLRYDSKRPFHFGMTLSIAFAFASTVLVGNMYYCQPLLIQISKSFNVTYDEVSRIPTLIQAGYTLGLALISPLGDLLRRRQLALCLVTLSTSLTIGLAVTNNLIVFQSLSFLVGVVSVTPHILLPLAADLASEKRRASTISVVISGLLFGIVVSRVLAGVISAFRPWRTVFYFAIAIQSFVLGGCYLMLPDSPSKNTNLTYFLILWTMAKLAATEPILIQACLINMAATASFGSFWVTLTFLLGGQPYHYSSLVIGLFGLIGMAGVSVVPVARRFIDRVVPWYASFLSIIMLMGFQALQVGAGGIHVAAPVIATFGLDLFRQSLHVSVTTTVLGISAPARARINTVSSLSNFIGQVMGTSVGSHIFIKFGWRAAAGFSLALYGCTLFILVARGPHCKQYTWLGYEGGTEARKIVVHQRNTQEDEKGPSQ